VPIRWGFGKVKGHGLVVGDDSTGERGQGLVLGKCRLTQMHVSVRGPKPGPPCATPAQMEFPTRNGSVF
jgi:hypothetical protein